MRNISFLGCGNMGQAFLESLLKHKVFTKDEISVLEKNEDKILFLKDKYGIQVSNNLSVLKSADIIFLAIKPQTLPEIYFTPKNEATLVSILAGTPIAKLREKFPDTKIVRAMPNLGQFVGQGMTGVCFDSDANFLEKEKQIVLQIFQSGGKMVEVSNESFMNKITAISGSGPAYFFLFVEQMIVAAQKLGFSKEEAQILTHETFFGAAEILRNHPDDTATEWRERVTSKGGTTEAALNVFQKSNFKNIILEATKAAEKRAQELGQ